MSMRTVIGAMDEVKVPARDDAPGARGLWLDPETLRRATGWKLEPAGLCRDDVCVPIDPSLGATLVRGRDVEASGLWTALRRPVVHDRARSIWVLGEGAADRSRPLDSGVAPDFTLPDATGQLHSLSDFRGKKVFLSTWASW